MSGVDAWVLTGALALAWVVLIGLLVRLAAESRARRKQHDDLDLRLKGAKWLHELLELRVRELERGHEELRDRLRREELRP